MSGNSCSPCIKYVTIGTNSAKKKKKESTRFRSLRSEMKIKLPLRSPDIKESNSSAFSPNKSRHSNKSKGPNFWLILVTSLKKNLSFPLAGPVASLQNE